MAATGMAGGVTCLVSIPGDRRTRCNGDPSLVAASISGVSIYPWLISQFRETVERLDHIGGRRGGYTAGRPD